MILSSFAFMSCSKKQQEQAVTTYGHSNAYLKPEEFVSKTDSYLKTPTNIDYILATNNVKFFVDKSVIGDYALATDNAIKQANGVTSKVTIGKTSDSSSSFKIQLSSEKPSKNVYAETSRKYDSNLLRNGGIITLYSVNLASKSKNFKFRTMLHEIGHIFGLEHITASELKSYTIMFDPHPLEESLQFTDYTEFDKENITWKYGT